MDRDAKTVSELLLTNPKMKWINVLNKQQSNKLAIAIPVFNGEKTLEGTLQNIAEQEYSNFRAYIYENKSTDNSLRIARKFCKKDIRFEIVESTYHMAIIDNFVRAIRHSSSKAEYFCLRACDDKSSTDYFTKLVDALDSDNSKLLAAGDAERISRNSTKKVQPNLNVFDFINKVKFGKMPRNLHFPSEWIYGIYRSNLAPEVLIRRLPELNSPWAAASYTVTEFVVRDLVTYVEGPVYRIFVGSDSVNLYFVKNWRGRFIQRWKYTIGCFYTHQKLPKMPLQRKIKFFSMCWNDARRKTRYTLIGIQKRPK